MSLVVKHAFVSAIADDPGALSTGEVCPQAHWNAAHDLSGTADAGQLNANVVQGVVNDTNVVGSISGQVLTFSWAGTLAAARLNSNVVQAVSNDTNVTGSISAQNLTLGWSGMLGLSRGGTAADLSATGGAHQVLKQVSAGAAVTVGQLAASDISGLAASATTDTTNAGNISSGTLAKARGGWGQDVSGSTGLPTFSAGSITFNTLGTGVVTALGVNTGSAGAFVVNGGSLGTPSSGTATNFTGLPISTGLTGAGTGVLAALAVNIGSAGAPVLFNGALGSPSSAGTIPAYTMGGTISGGGNQINNLGTLFVNNTSALTGSEKLRVTGPSGTGIDSIITVFDANSFQGNADFVVYNSATADTANQSVFILQGNTTAGRDTIFNFQAGFSDINSATKTATVRMFAAAGGSTQSAATIVGQNWTFPGAITFSSSAKSTSPTAGIGYATGAGGTVTQATSKSTGVSLNAASGAITMNAAALAAGTIVSFVLTDTAIAATDVLILNHISGGTRGAYTLEAACAAGSATIFVRNNTGGSLSEAIVIQFALIKGVNS